MLPCTYKLQMSPLSEININGHYMLRKQLQPLHTPNVATHKQLINDH